MESIDANMENHYGCVYVCGSGFARYYSTIALSIYHQNLYCVHLYACMPHRNHFSDFLLKMDNEVILNVSTAHQFESVYPAVYLYKQDVWHGKEKKYEQADMFTENQKSLCPVSFFSQLWSTLKKISFSLFCSQLYLLLNAASYFDSNKMKGPSSSHSPPPPISKQKKRNKYSLSSRKLFLRMDSNVQCFSREGLHVAPWGRDRDPSINRPRSLWKNGKRKSSLSFSNHATPRPVSLGIG